jgi:hypothetical protein
MPLTIPASIVDAAVAANRSISDVLKDVQNQQDAPRMTRAEMLREAQGRKVEIMALVPKITSLDEWNVIDSKPEGLYMLGPEEETMEKYGFLIGMVIDLPNRVILSGSPGFNHTSVANMIESDPNGDIHLTDIFGDDHHLKKDRFTIRPFFEGVRLRVFYHDGEMYVSSDKKINVDKSKVPGSITFLEMYESLGGPPVEELYDTSKSYSPWVYHFTISTSDTRWVNKIRNPTGLLIFDGPTSTYDATTSPYVPNEVDYNMWNIDANTTRDFGKVMSGSTDEIFALIPIDLDMANSFLVDGFNPSVNDPENKADDIRLGPGEAVIITVTPEGEDPYQIQVWSPAYEWRFGIVGENSHLPHQFYVLANMMYIDTNSTEGLEDFESKMPLFPQYEVKQLSGHIMEKGPLQIWPNELKPKIADVSTEEGRLYNVWASLLMAVPFDQQKVVAPLFVEFFEKRDEVIEWIQKVEESYDVIDTDSVGPRVNVIIKDARRLATTKTMPGLSTTDQIKRNIEYFMDNEYTDSLYRLIKNMRNWHRLQEKDEQE